MPEMSEDQIRSSIVGDVAEWQKVLLVDYDPAWPQLYETEAERIRGALGPGALRIEHTGSTSVPGLAAKPVIDIVLVVTDSSNEDAYVPLLEAAGYVVRVREPDWLEHRMFIRPAVRVHVHVYSQGCPEIERMVGFRDWLRATDSDRELYERTKRELAARDWKFVQNYADAKTAVIQEILGRAQSSR